MDASAPPPPAPPENPAVVELRQKHQLDLEKLKLTTQPFRTLIYFLLATLQWLKRSSMYLLKSGMWLLLLVAAFSVFAIRENMHGENIQEIYQYAKFVFWWIALGVASSIGLGSGLHTFLLYLGPHIALFTIKAVKCGRIDLKTAPYDTILLKTRPSWLEKNCLEFGPAIFMQPATSLVRIPLSKILPQVQLEAVLWGIGTALGELPPYFIARAASLAGRRIEDVEVSDSDTSTYGLFSGILRRAKHWLLSHAEYLNFFTILCLAAIPNPLFDVAGIMCGQFGVPFWTFFLATLIGKAIVKAHLQTAFIITLCNNQLLEFAEKRVIWLFKHIPGSSAVLPSVISKMEMVKEKFLTERIPSTVSPTKKWNISFSLIWNTIIWIMITNFFIQIVTSTAQGYLKKQQEQELSIISSSSSKPDRRSGAN